MDGDCWSRQTAVVLLAMFQKVVAKNNTPSLIWHGYTIAPTTKYILYRNWAVRALVDMVGVL